MEAVAEAATAPDAAASGGVWWQGAALAVLFTVSHAVSTTMRLALHLVLNIAYYVSLPFVWLAEHLLAALAIVLAPVLHVLTFAVHILLLLPLRLLAKLETLYVFFGTAVTLGLLTGLILYVSSVFLSPLLGISTPVPTAEHNDSIDYDVKSHSQRDIEDDSAHLDLHHDRAEKKPASRTSQKDAAPPEPSSPFRGLTAASFNALRAEKRAREAQVDALLGLVGKGTTNSSSRGGGGGGGQSAGTSQKPKSKPKTAHDGWEWDRDLADQQDSSIASTHQPTTTAASTVPAAKIGRAHPDHHSLLGAPTPMMGTTILEEEDDDDELDKGFHDDDDDDHEESLPGFNNRYGHADNTDSD